MKFDGCKTDSSLKMSFSRLLTEVSSVDLERKWVNETEIMESRPTIVESRVLNRKLNKRKKIEARCSLMSKL